MNKSLDIKIDRIRNDSSCQDFIIADAKDGDMGFGVAAPGVNQGDDQARFPYRTLASYMQSMREITEAGLVDIMLMSASVNEQLTIDERLFDDTPVTPAVRANDTTDIWLGMSGDYKHQPSLCFRSTTIDHIQAAKINPTDDERQRGANLGLYSITFNNDAVLDREASEAYKSFRLEAETKGFRHFLEVFAPNATGTRDPADVGRFVNDSIARVLAGVTRSARPLFLKMPYFGPAAMERLVHYEPALIPGDSGWAGRHHA